MEEKREEKGADNGGSLSHPPGAVLEAAAAPALHDLRFPELFRMILR